MINLYLYCILLPLKILFGEAAIKYVTMYVCIYVYKVILTLKFEESVNCDHSRESHKMLIK